MWSWSWYQSNVKFSKATNNPQQKLNCLLLSPIFLNKDNPDICISLIAEQLWTRADPCRLPACFYVTFFMWYSLCDTPSMTLLAWHVWRDTICVSLGAMRLFRAAMTWSIFSRASLFALRRIWRCATREAFFKSYQTSRKIIRNSCWVGPLLANRSGKPYNA